ncbi:YggS family pyridoxal phosphate-dependent enzyme [Longispora sp. NPDC051575]|uniref:YggS family pyridoxal phosphate-dependent enzyme n=1 Tax=Longispora sp. NPDC051575 TaxID=3154943 RepID=UPI003432A5A5
MGSGPESAADSAGDTRRRELADGLARVRARIDAACAAAGRDPGEVTLVAVTKTYPASDVVHLRHLGVRDVGENRDAEAAPKAALVAEALAGEIPGPAGLGAGQPIWHYIGQLQRNKARSVVRYADMVHSVDRPALVEALAAAVARERPDRPLDVLLQLSLDGAVGRGGVPRPELAALADAVLARPELRLRGLMAVAPLDWEAARAFGVLAEYTSTFLVGYPTATVLSAGMSGDLAEAIAFGATHVRVGSAILGSRPPAGLA